MEADNGCNAFTENVKAEVFVGRVDGVAFETEAHEHRFHTQHAFEIRNDGDTAAAAHGQGAFAESLRKPFFGRAISRQRDGANIAFAAVHRRHFDVDAVGSQTLHVVHKHLAHLFVLLMRH